MAKFVTRFLGLMFVVAVLFLFSACYSSPFGGNSGGGGNSGNYGPIGGGTSDDKNNTIPDEGMFAVDENGNYTYFKDQTEIIKGVQLMSVPSRESESKNEDTNKERRRFYEDLEMQFYVLSTYTAKYLVGQFGGGISASEICFEDKEFKDDYVLKISALTPAVQNSEIGDTNEFVIERFVKGWDYDESEVLTPIYSEENAWKLSLGSNNIDGDYEQQFVEKYEPFLRLRLIEIVSNNLFKTTYKTLFADVQTPDACLKMIEQRLLNFQELGFEFEGTVADQFKAFLESEVIGENAINFQTGSKTFSEPSFVQDEETKFYDINKNGVFDESFQTDSMFVVDYDGILNTLMENLSSFVDGSEGIFPKVDAMEVQGIEAKDFFHPGLKASESENSKNSLTNMDYAQYQSCVIFSSQDATFDFLNIFVDAQTDFKLKIWARFCYGDVSFTVPICVMDLDSTKDYDWENFDDSMSGSDDIDITSPETEESKQAEKQKELDYLFGENTKRNMTFVQLECVLSTEQFQVLKQNGLKAYDKDLDFLGRGYHTNSKDNLALCEIYDFKTLNYQDEEKTLLCYNGQDNYVEFLFEIVDAEPEKEYNFKFVLEFGEMYDKNFDPDNLNSGDLDVDIMTTSNSLDFDRKLRKNFE